MKTLDSKRRIHFVGIGGIGMSAIAHVLLEMGYKVSGSDVETNDLTRRIETIGGRVFEGHHASNILDDTGMLVYSTSISRDNPELDEAQKRSIPVVHRAQVLAELFNKKKGIAVTGTHGKTTTTSLISVILRKAGLDPTVIIGGEVNCFKGNSSCGKGEYLVAEADESDSSFLHLKPAFAVVTNMEPEHLDHYKSMDEIRASFRSFIDNVEPGGKLFYCHDDMNIRQILDGYKGSLASYGFSDDADIYPADIRMNGFNTTYTCVYKDKILGNVRLKLPGRHNVLNSLAAILLGLDLGLDFNTIAGAIRTFSGAKRRFQLRCKNDGVMLIDDYAHHPTEIRAVLDACRNWKDKRVIVVFQPHRYTRTKFLADEFGACFKGAHKLVLTDIFPASEPPIEGVSIKNIYEKVKANGIEDVSIVKKDDIVEHILRIKRCGDMILVLGAGDIKKVADELAMRLSTSSKSDPSTALSLGKIIKGKIRTDEMLAGHTSFRIGGPADIWVEPSDAADLRRVLKFARKNKVPLFIIGNGSNLLVNDCGFRGIVARLSAPYFNSAFIKGKNVRAGAGFSLPKLIKMCCDRSLAGLESLAGIPGTVGGAVYMNAGGSANPMYKNIGDLVTSVRVMDYSGTMKIFRKKDLVFGYRRSSLQPYIILEVTLKLSNGESGNIASSFNQFISIKREKQALDIPSAGCVFKNPPGFQFTCGQMIDMLGLKGKTIGGAEISSKHANFIVNRGGANAKDVLAMIDLVKGRVRENYKVPLELEIKVL